MKEIKTTCTKGTRILLGNEKRDMINRMIDILRNESFVEIQIPIIQNREMFIGKVGEENQHMMYEFKDRGGRDLCLAPEYTAVVQELAKTYFKQDKDLKVFYVAECFRGEKPQALRYRQFTQLGVEILNPTKEHLEYLKQLAALLILSSNVSGQFVVRSDVERGLDYYKNGQGFEVTCDALGNGKQVCGGGEYDGGCGFAIGIDRLINAI